MNTSHDIVTAANQMLVQWRHGHVLKAEMISEFMAIYLGKNLVTGEYYCILRGTNIVVI